jgi:hypothetical protein
MTYTHTFKIKKTKVDIQCADYIFNYIIGYGCCKFTKRTISKTFDPLVFSCTYEFDEENFSWIDNEVKRLKLNIE